MEAIAMNKFLETEFQKRCLVLLLGIGIGGSVATIRMSLDIQSVEEKASTYQERLVERTATIRELESDRDRLKAALCGKVKNHRECREPLSYNQTLSVLKRISSCLAIGTCPSLGEFKSNE
jgi:hypothetical protein